MMLRAEVIVPARFGRAVQLSAGDAVEVENLHGTQVVDSWAFAAEDPAEYLAMDQTRSVNSTISIRCGMTLVSNRRRVMLSMVEDTSPGVHDTLLCACNAAIYSELGCPADHRSCEQNLHEALAGLGRALSFTPSPFNLFMNVPIAVDGTIDRVAPIARPGDRVRFVAAIDLVAVFSACPQDVTPINGVLRVPSDVLLRHLVPGGCE
jgi:uncharacterized protein